jgi:hypothetical protein
MRVLCVGDIHDDWGRLQAAASDAAAISAGAIFQVGDVGMGAEFHAWVASISPLPVPIYLVDGNHEDHAWIAAAVRSGEIEAWKAKNIHYQARGSVIRLGDCTCGFLGGALHAHGVEQEGSCHVACGLPPPFANWITDADLERSLAAFQSTPPDLLVTHDAPGGIGLGLISDDSWHRHVQEGAREIGKKIPWDRMDGGDPCLHKIWQRLPRRPRFWVHGHWHHTYHRRVQQTEFYGIGIGECRLLTCTCG